MRTRKKNRLQISTSEMKKRMANGPLTTEESKRWTKKVRSKSGLSNTPEYYLKHARTNPIIAELIAVHVVKDPTRQNLNEDIQFDQGRSSLRTDKKRLCKLAPKGKDAIYVLPNGTISNKKDVGATKTIDGGVINERQEVTHLESFKFQSGQGGAQDLSCADQEKYIKNSVSVVEKQMRNDYIAPSIWTKLPIRSVNSSSVPPTDMSDIYLLSDTQIVQKARSITGKNNTKFSTVGARKAIERARKNMRNKKVDTLRRIKIYPNRVVFAAVVDGSYYTDSKIADLRSLIPDFAKSRVKVISSLELGKLVEESHSLCS